MALVIKYLRVCFSCFSALCLFFIGGCGKNPVTGETEIQWISPEQEVAIGEQEFGYMQQAEGGPFETAPSINAYVSKVGNKLAAVSDRPNLPYEFVVLNNSIPNAWALPGGKIAINRGLLIELDSEAELAAVLAHEIVHSAARHAAKQIERNMLLAAGVLGVQGLMHDHKYEDVAVGSAAVGAGLLSLKYSRSAELEADKYGIKYMAAAGYNPYAAVCLQETFLRLSKGKNPEWLGGFLSTHPPTEERLQANRIAAAKYPQGLYWGWDAYREAIQYLTETKQAYLDLDEGYLVLKQGRAQQALTLAEKGLQIAPKESYLYNLKGKAQVQLRDLQGALNSFNTAIALNPHYFDFFLQRGLLKQKLGDWRGAQADLQQSEQLLPSAQAEYALGVIALQNHDRNAAIFHFKRASLNPSETGVAARQQLHRLGVRP